MAILEEKALEFCSMFTDSVVILNDDKEKEKEKEIAGFTCPTCGEPIYFEDWDDGDTENWLRCPICMFYFSGSDEEI